MGFFALDAVEAKAGDALVLRWGPTEEEAQLVLIDGGPRGVYTKNLLPHLQALVGTLPTGEQRVIPLRLAVVSHIDSDHIAGVLDVLDEVSDAAAAPRPALVTVDELWHNSFLDIAFRDDPDLADLVKEREELGPDGIVAVPESVREGRNLSTVAKKAGVPRNPDAPGDGFVTTGAEVEIDGLNLEVLGPTDALVELLKEEWRKELKAILKKEISEAKAEAASFDDPSESNQSSIVLLATHGDKTMFLTGDARGDHLIEAITPKVPDGDDHLHVDLFKLGHHGSARSNGPELFELVRADVYVVSGDGNHGNPHPDTIEALYETQEGRDYELVVTNAVLSGASDADDREDAEKTMELLADPPAGCTVVPRAEDDRAITTRLS